MSFPPFPTTSYYSPSLLLPTFTNTLHSPLYSFYRCFHFSHTTPSSFSSQPCSPLPPATSCCTPARPCTPPALASPPSGSVFAFQFRTTRLGHTTTTACSRALGASHGDVSQGLCRCWHSVCRNPSRCLCVFLFLTRSRPVALVLRSPRSLLEHNNTSTATHGCLSGLRDHIHEIVRGRRHTGSCRRHRRRYFPIRSLQAAFYR